MAESLNDLYLKVQLALDSAHVSSPEEPADGDCHEKVATEKASSETMSDCSMLKQLALAAKRSGDMGLARSYMSQILTMQCESVPVNSSGHAKVKALVARISQQVIECQQAVRVSLERGDKLQAASFLRHQKAFESDLHQLRAALPLKNQAKPPSSKAIPMSIPLSNTNSQILPDELHILLSNLKVSPRPKVAISPQQRHFIQITLEWPQSDDHPAHKKAGQLFSIPVDSGWDEHVIWPGIRREIRTAKFFGHHKMRLELFRQEHAFFSKRNVLVGSVALRLAPLVAESVVSETLEFVDEGRRGLGITLSVTLTIRDPLSPKTTAATKQVEWLTLEHGESGRLFRITSHSAKEQETVVAENFLSSICSYVVLDYEIQRLKGVDASSADDPQNVAKLIALEDKLEQLTIQVDIGELSIEEYLAQVRQAVPAAKQRALAAKRAGDLASAKDWLQHVILMEKEIEEAEQPPKS